MFEGFDKLDLSDTEVSGGSILEAGINHLTCTEAEVNPAASNPSNMVLLCKFAVEGGGEIRNYFNIHNSNEQAERIGKEQLKRFLIAAEHPTPDKPSDVSSLKGLKVTVDLQLGRPRKDTGQQYLEIKRWFKYMDEGAKASSPPASSKGDSTSEFREDKIPF
tara:strand:+ start:2369 stop:2854 length:486 start_codon:yes stop_codon:yes gene_type:complete